MFARFTLGLVLALVLTICPTPRAAEPPKDRDGNPLPPGAVARLGTLSFRLATSDQAHGSMALSHDGKRVAVFETGKVHVWEVETGKTLRQFDYPFHPGYVEPVAISADGKRVIAFNADSGVQAWDVETGEVLFSHEEVGRSRASMGIGFLADGTAVYSRNFSTGDGNFVALHDAKTKKELTQFKGELGHSFALDINPDGKTLTGGMFDRENDCVHVRIYDAKTFELKKGIDDVAKGEGCNVAGSCPDGSTLLIVTTSGDITFWSVAEGKMLSKLEEKPLNIDHPVPATLSWDGKIAAVSGWEDGTVRLFDTATGKLVKKLDGAGKGGYLVMSKDGKRLAHRGTHAVQIWDVASGKEMHRDLPSHRSVPTAIAYSPDGKQVASAGGGEIVLWDLANGKALARWDAFQGKKSATVDRLRFSADGKHLVASGTGLATLWDVPTRKLVHKWQGEEIHFAAFHPDAKKLYIATPDGKMELWDIATRKPLESNNEVLDDTHELLVTSGGERVILSGIDGLAFYHPKTLREVASIPREEGSWYACPTPDATGRRVGVVRTSDLVWTVLEPEGSPPRTGEALHGVGRELQSHAHNRRLFAAFLGVDPRAGTGGALVLLDRATGKVRHRMSMPFTEVRGMAFAPDGRHLATCNGDTTILVWDTWNLPGESVPIEGASAKLQQIIDQIMATNAEFAPAEELTAEKLRERWERFGGEEVAGLDSLIESMCRKPKQTVPFLAERLEQAKKIDLEALRRLLDQLESNRFAVREKASKELARLGDPAAAELRKRRDAATNEDLRKRLDTLLQSIDSPFLSGDTLRAYRGIEILERINTPEAKELLKKLANGEPEAVLTREAKAALKE